MVWSPSYALARPRAEATRPDERPRQTPKRGPGAKASKRGNAAARRPQTARERTQNGAISGASEFCKKNLWPSFGKATDRGRRSLGQGLGKPDKRPKRVLERTLQNRETQQRGARKRTKNGPISGPQTGRLNSVRKTFGRALARHLMLSWHAQPQTCCACIVGNSHQMPRALNFEAPLGVCLAKKPLAKLWRGHPRFSVASPRSARGRRIYYSVSNIILYICTRFGRPQWSSLPLPPKMQHDRYIT